MSEFEVYKPPPSWEIPELDNAPEDVVFSHQRVYHASKFVELGTTGEKASGDRLYQGWIQYAGWKRSVAGLYAYNRTEGRVSKQESHTPFPIRSILMMLQGVKDDELANASVERGHEIFREDIALSFRVPTGLFKNITRLIDMDKMAHFCQDMDNVGWTPGDLLLKYPTSAVPTSVSVRRETPTLYGPSLKNADVDDGE